MRVEIEITITDDTGATVIERMMAVEGELEDLVNIPYSRLTQEMVNRIKAEAGLDPV